MLRGMYRDLQFVTHSKIVGERLLARISIESNAQLVDYTDCFSGVGYWITISLDEQIGGTGVELDRVL